MVVREEGKASLSLTSQLGEVLPYRLSELVGNVYCLRQREIVLLFKNLIWSLISDLPSTPYQPQGMELVENGDKDFPSGGASSGCLCRRILVIFEI